jgi:hypothetical protein
MLVTSVLRSRQPARPPSADGQTYVTMTSGRFSSVFWCARCVQLKMSAALLTSCSFFSAYTACVPSAGGVRRTEEGRTLRVRDARGLARAADAHALPRREEHGAHERGRNVEEAGARVRTCLPRHDAGGTHPSGTTIVVTMAELWVVGGGEGGRRRSWLGDDDGGARPF